MLRRHSVKCQNDYGCVPEAVPAYIRITNNAAVLIQTSTAAVFLRKGERHRAGSSFAQVSTSAREPWGKLSVGRFFSFSMQSVTR